MFVGASVGVGVGVWLWCEWVCEWCVPLGGVGMLRCLSVECQDVSNEQAVGGHAAVRLTWGVMWLVWCCGLQQEGPLVLCS
jgi:hypothetical protein